jgi:type I restriction enzyme R subunit
VNRKDPGLTPVSRFRVFDVLAHVAYALPPLSREERAAKAKVEISTDFNSKQQVFLDFVLSHYVIASTEVRINIADASSDLGRPDELGRVFVAFQKYLYEKAT